VNVTNTCNEISLVQMILAMILLLYLHVTFRDRNITIAYLGSFISPLINPHCYC